MSKAMALLRPLLPPRARTAFLCVGSELREDDYAGAYLATLLMHRSGGDLLVMDGATAPESCTGPIRSFAPDAVIVFDAAWMGKEPGEYAILPPEIITGATFSTHMLPLPVTLSYLETCCGCKTAYVGIQPYSIGQGIGMHKQVKAGVEKLAGELAALLDE